ncbi:MAG: FliI/YscN family ATPase [Bdellovibrionales bacterium]|nr:FliI/YscN family ATPase [Bdellovibrionales bacterium]
MEINFGHYTKALSQAQFFRENGKVTQVTGFLLRGYLPGACVGAICQVFSAGGDSHFFAEVVGFRERDVFMMPLGEMRGVGLGSKLILCTQQASVGVGPQLLGRVLNALGEPIDGKEPLSQLDEKNLYSEIVNPLLRPPISLPLTLGVRSIDGLLTLGRGQRVGIMAGSGVGKSVLMGMTAKSSHADVNVIGLIGERGREVREFIEHTLGEEGLKKSIIIVATSDQNPLLRMRAAFVTSSIAEYFCAQGAHVLLMMDSVTRFAMAQREVGLNVGEPPTAKGYTPSVFSMLPKLLERAGNYEGQGSITGLYTVLVEGDDMDEPIADAVRSIVDGHIVLDRTLAQKGHYPAVDVLQSISRVMRNIVPIEHLQMAKNIRENLATYKEAEDLINLGAYKSGSNARIDRAIKLQPKIEEFLKQDVQELQKDQDVKVAMGKIFS